MSYVMQPHLDRNRGDYPFPGHGYTQQPLLGLGSAPMAPPKWWEVTPAFWAAARPLGFDDYPQRSQAEAAGGPVFLSWFPGWSDGTVTTPPIIYARFGSGSSVPFQVPADKVASSTQAMQALQAASPPTLTDADVTSRLLNPGVSTNERPYSLKVSANRTGLVIAGLGVAALLGGVYYLGTRTV